MDQRKILITGGAGYLGGILLRSIHQASDLSPGTVRVLDNLSTGTPQVLMDLPEGGPEAEFIEGDILDPTAVERALEEVDTVVHLAAVVTTPFAFSQPENITQVNQWGTIRLLDQCQDAGIDRFVYASTASVYGPGEGHAEDDPCRPVGPYSHTKRQAEQALAERAGDGLETTILRFASLYGGDPRSIRFDAFLNKFAYLAGTGRTLAVHGSGEQERPILHVEDAARAILHVLDDSSATVGIFNAVDANPTVGEVAETAGKIGDVAVRYTQQDYRDHISLSVDGSKLRATGWAPEISLEQGLEALVQRFENLSIPDRPSVDVP